MMFVMSMRVSGVLEYGNKFTSVINLWINTFKQNMMAKQNRKK